MQLCCINSRECLAKLDISIIPPPTTCNKLNTQPKILHDLENNYKKLE